MKKLLTLLLCVIMVVVFMPTMAFATADTEAGTGVTDVGTPDAGGTPEDGTTEKGTTGGDSEGTDEGDEPSENTPDEEEVDENGMPLNAKVRFTLESGATKATVTAYNDYRVEVKIVGETVNSNKVTATLEMKNVGGLGVQGYRRANIDITTGISKTANWAETLDKIRDFEGATINGNVNDKAFSYNVSGLTQSEDGVRTLTATPANLEAVRAAWLELVGKITTATQTPDDSKVKMPAGAYLQIGTEKLTVDEELTIDPSGNGGFSKTIKAIKDAVRLYTGVSTEGENLVMYAPKGSILQVGESIATLDTGVKVMSNVSTQEQILAKIRAFINLIVEGVPDGKLALVSEMINSVNTAVAGVDENGLTVSILTDCQTISLDDRGTVTTVGKVNGKPIGNLPAPTEPAPQGKRFDGWYNGDTKVTAATVVEGDMTFTAKYVTPFTGTYTPPTDNVTNSGTTGTGSATTTADVNTTTSGGTTSAVVDKTTADKIVDNAVSNQSTEVVVDVTTGAGTAGNTTVTLPTDTVQKISDKTNAEVTVKTDAAEVTLDQKAVEAVAAKAAGSTVELLVEKTKDETKGMEFELKVVSGGVVIGDFNGGNVKVTVKLNSALKALKDALLTCVYIDDNGKYSKVGGAKNADGTYTFVTDHFSSYAIMAEEEADGVIAAQNKEAKEAVKNTKLVARTAMSKAKGKKAVKVYWKAKDGSKLDFDGYEVYRSLKKDKGYGKKPFFKTTKTKYYNTSVKKGTKYYYRVRAYKLIDGEKVYTDYSTKAWRTVK